MINFELNSVTKLVLQIILLLIVGFLASKSIKIVLGKIFKLNRDESTIETEGQQITITILRHVISVIQTIIWVVICLSISGLLEMTAFVQLIAALGVIIGYVARDFVNDFIMGILVLIEQQFGVGDVVTLTAINQLKGQVIEIGIRTTKLRLIETNEVYIVSNRLITSVIVHPKVKRNSRKEGIHKNVKK